jgi:WXG100 family type VII secretion target
MWGIHAGETSMTEPGTQVDHVEMGKAAQKVADATNVIAGLETRVDTHLTNLISGWKGDASAAFERLLRTWLLDFQDIRKQLGIVADKLGGTQRSYAATEQYEQDAINRLNSLLNYK